MEKTLDLRVQKTYIALNNAFTELIEKKRFEDITINELCEKAMVRRTTFYKHFDDKIDYFAFYLKETAKLFQMHSDTNESIENINTYFLMMCRNLITFTVEHKAFVDGIIQSNLFPLLLDILIDTIRSDLISVYKKQNHNQISIDDFNLKAAFYAGGILSALYQYLKTEKNINENKFIDTITNFLTDN